MTPVATVGSDEIASPGHNSIMLPTATATLWVSTVWKGFGLPEALAVGTLSSIKRQRSIVAYRCRSIAGSEGEAKTSGPVSGFTATGLLSSLVEGEMSPTLLSGLAINVGISRRC
jgi:hypothetical protein